MSNDREALRMASDIDEPSFVVHNPRMLNLLAVADRAATSDGKVLITGETGVGKDLFARRIHTRSRRRSHPFVAVNCAGLTESLLESELFGHVKGSFTGAYRDKPGKLQAARKQRFRDCIENAALRVAAASTRCRPSLARNDGEQPVRYRLAHRPIKDICELGAGHRERLEPRAQCAIVGNHGLQPPALLLGELSVDVRHQDFIGHDHCQRPLTAATGAAGPSVIAA